MSTRGLVAAAFAAALAVAATPARATPATGRPVTCHACVVVDDLGTTVWARRAHVGLPNASTTKIVTAMVAVRAADPMERVRVSRTAAATDGGGVDLDPGDVYTVEALLYALLLSSSNDAAVALAEHVAGSVDAFVARMNRLAERHGADDTHFETPHGLDTAGHVASAADLATLAAALLDHPLLAKMVRTPRVMIEGPEGRIAVANRNVLLKTYSGAIGVKTGYTAAAGDVLVAAARRRGRTLIAVAMRSQNAAADAARLLDLGFARVARTVLVSDERAVADLVVDPAGATGVVPSHDVRGAADPRTVEVAFVPDPELDLPIEAGEAVGSIRLRASGRIFSVVPARAAGDLPEERGAWLAEAFGDLLGAAHAVTSAVGLR